jgi:chitinase
VRPNRIAAAVSCALALSASSHAQDTGYQILGYFPEWGVYQQPFYVKNIVTAGSAPRVTVLNYAFSIPKPDPATNTITCQMDDPVAAYQQVYDASMSVDGVADQPTQPLRGHFNQLKKLKARFPNVKVTIAVGGWLGSTYFSDAARTDASRKAFVKSCLDLWIRGHLPVQNGAGGTGVGAGVFDGVDLDWEYPVSGGYSGTHHNRNDGKNLTLLLQEFRTQFAEIRPGLLLSQAVSCCANNGDNYDIPSNHHLVDWLNLMSYDLHGDWNHTTGHLTNLCTSPEDPASEAWRLSVDRTVRLYRDTYGVPAHKLLIGSAFYGRGWKRVKTANSGLYQGASGAAPGLYEPGYNYYRDLKGLTAQGYGRFWDDWAKASWLFSPTQRIFWSWDDPQSLGLKAQYVKAWGLGGIMFWEISGDDDQGTLLAAVHNGLANAAAADPCPYR